MCILHVYVKRGKFFKTALNNKKERIFWKERESEKKGKGKSTERRELQVPRKPPYHICTRMTEPAHLYIHVCIQLIHEITAWDTGYHK